MGRKKKHRSCRLLSRDHIIGPTSAKEVCGVTLMEADEFEALRLCDLDNLDQSAAAAIMNVSRATIQRMLRTGRRKMVAALLNRYTIRIKGETHMNICIPTVDDNGLQSTVSPHFGMAPFFTLVNTETMETRGIANERIDHGQGACKPLAGLEGFSVDVLIVSGMGHRAIARLAEPGTQAFLFSGKTVAEAIKAWRSDELQPLTPNAACSGHGR